MTKLTKEYKEWIDNYVDFCNRECSGCFTDWFTMPSMMAMEMHIDYAEAREIYEEWQKSQRQ